VRSWKAAGKRSAVVRVHPVAEPPCVTTGGQLYERVSGETIPGRRTERAEANALRAVEAVLVGAVVREGPG
jgi:hypothetical protein